MTSFHELVFQQAGQECRGERGYLSTPGAYHHTRTDVTVSAADYRATYGALRLAADALDTLTLSTPEPYPRWRESSFTSFTISSEHWVGRQLTSDAGPRIRLFQHHSCGKSRENQHCPLNLTDRLLVCRSIVALVDWFNGQTHTGTPPTRQSRIFLYSLPASHSSWGWIFFVIVIIIIIAFNGPLGEIIFLHLTHPIHG